RRRISEGRILPRAGAADNDSVALPCIEADQLARGLVVSEPDPARASNQTSLYQVLRGRQARVPQRAACLLRRPQLLAMPSLSQVLAGDDAPDDAGSRQCPAVANEIGLRVQVFFKEANEPANRQQ